MGTPTQRLILHQLPDGEKQQRHPPEGGQRGLSGDPQRPHGHAPQLPGSVELLCTPMEGGSWMEQVEAVLSPPVWEAGRQSPLTAQVYGFRLTEQLVVYISSRGGSHSLGGDAALGSGDQHHGVRVATLVVWVKYCQQVNVWCFKSVSILLVFNHQT
ncbi:hypothetical protein EYF80_057425 [Liparis tanakae]|uniref:Uncharacterized protein n=1 Tax=Liparis tanakae TaxID=230148 RepID=A0A4Z2EU23_9TELE|nr:hypothetical protein EYF80_057425 [Liparis tanakae]